ncbi:hypothetical protein BCR36DRAFT_68481 [Piromyces finnis]|uniref:Uncharacterized protein n=1 Tax=Piromyces finnis TaxID=1754191 RepID=A0A1Y1V825_9FUNG|nr:hypothetical protein BCR36DRAFT_68481 [Piromyces finnis]|eukprot:ORX49340.1 hypothetical protein BCR36DRAFT_68481 [Piromyces finnis]
MINSFQLFYLFYINNLLVYIKLIYNNILCIIHTLLIYILIFIFLGPRNSIKNVASIKRSLIINNVIKD